MENLLVMRSQKPISPQRATASNEAIRQFLVEAGEVYGRQITAALVGIWQRELRNIAATALRKAFSETLQACRFFPTPADVLKHVQRRDRWPNLFEGGDCYAGPRQIDYPKPARMTAEDLKQHNEEMAALRARIGPSSRPRTSKEALRIAEQKLGERETNPEILQRIERQKAELRTKGMLA